MKDVTEEISHQLMTMLLKMVSKLKPITNTLLEMENVNMMLPKLFSNQRVTLQSKKVMESVLKLPPPFTQSQSVSKPIHQLSNSILQEFLTQNHVELI